MANANPQFLRQCRRPLVAVESGAQNTTRSLHRRWRHAGWNAEGCCLPCWITANGTPELGAGGRVFPLAGSHYITRGSPGRPNGFHAAESTALLAQSRRITVEAVEADGVHRQQGQGGQEAPPEPAGVRSAPPPLQRGPDRPDGRGQQKRGQQKGPPHAAPHRDRQMMYRRNVAASPNT